MGSFRFDTENTPIIEVSFRFVSILLRLVSILLRFVLIPRYRCQMLPVRCLSYFFFFPVRSNYISMFGHKPSLTVLWKLDKQSSSTFASRDIKTGAGAMLVLCR